MGIAFSVGQGPLVVRACAKPSSSTLAFQPARLPRQADSFRSLPESISNPRLRICSKFARARLSSESRPEQIEPALASWPGRIDQAIEFPLPDEEGRTKLTKIYARGLEISDGVLETVVSRTKGVSAAFIKELMRRCAQFQIESSRDSVLTQAAVDAAIEEMLFTGGALNRRLLGGAGAKPSLNASPHISIG